MIVDAHAHIGSCRVFEANQTGEQLIAAMDAAGVDAAVVQPFPGSRDPVQDHDRIAQLAGAQPGRIFGLVSLNPHRDPSDYKAEVTRCVRDLGFVGVKAHSIGHAVNPLSSDARLVFETAVELGVPVMVHTGSGIPFAEPAMWIPLAADVAPHPVILAHAGAGIFTGPAIVAAQLCDNVYLETSWCNPQDIGRAIQTLGEERVLFGSDMVFNIQPELAKYSATGFSDHDLVSPLGTNAIRVFRLRIEPGRT